VLKTIIRSVYFRSLLFLLLFALEIFDFNFLDLDFGIVGGNSFVSIQSASVNNWTSLISFSFEVPPVSTPPSPTNLSGDGVSNLNTLFGNIS